MTRASSPNTGSAVFSTAAGAHSRCTESTACLTNNLPNHMTGSATTATTLISTAYVTNDCYNSIFKLLQMHRTSHPVEFAGRESQLHGPPNRHAGEHQGISACKSDNCHDCHPRSATVPTARSHLRQGHIVHCKSMLTYDTSQQDPKTSQQLFRHKETEPPCLAKHAPERLHNKAVMTPAAGVSSQAQQHAVTQQ